MKRYFKNLWLAIIGINPSSGEVDEVQKAYEATENKIASLRKIYCAVVEKWEWSENQLKIANEKLAAEYKKGNEYEKLIENLRERLSEKDMLIERMKDHYQQRQQLISQFMENAL